MSLLKLNDLKKPQDFGDVFGNKNPLILDIGAGRGEFAIAQAREHQNLNFICIEKRPQRTAVILERAKRHELKNLCIIQAQFEQIFPHCFFRQSIHRAYMNFPDPWPKNKYRNRRNLNEEFALILGDVLETGAEFHFASDVLSYVEESQSILQQSRLFDLQIPISSELPENQKTLFYRHAKSDGLPSYFMVLSRNTSPLPLK